MLSFTKACHWLRAAIFFSVFACAPALCAQEPTTTLTTEANPEANTVRSTLDLGKFKIHDLRPTRNETAKLTFTLHLALASTVSQQQQDQLQHWKHRLRNQVIIAVRTIEIKDFQSPDLALLRQKIRIRINRLFQAKLVEEVFLTEYLFRLH